MEEGKNQGVYQTERRERKRADLSTIMRVVKQEKLSSTT